MKNKFKKMFLLLASSAGWKQSNRIKHVKPTKNLSCQSDLFVFGNLIADKVDPDKGDVQTELADWVG
jgi:hypothetical protein